MSLSLIMYYYGLVMLYKILAHLRDQRPTPILIGAPGIVNIGI